MRIEHDGWGAAQHNDTTDRRVGVGGNDYALGAHASHSGTRLVHKAIGYAVFAFGAVCLLALMTWDINDPSLTHSTSNPVTNWMGFAGASYADLSFQFFGIAGLGALLPLIFLGRAFLRDLPYDHRSRRSLSWLGATFLFAGMLACFPATSAWPFQTGLGGVVGDITARIPGIFASGAYPTGLYAAICAVLFGSIAAWMMAIACGLGAKPAAGLSDGFTPEEHQFDADDGEKTGVIALTAGAVLHWAYVAKSWASTSGLSFTTKAPHSNAASAEQAQSDFSDNQSAYDRQEPSFDIGAPSADFQTGGALNIPADYELVSAPSMRETAPEFPPTLHDIPQQTARVSAPAPAPAAAAPTQHRSRAAAAGPDGFELPDLEMLTPPQNRVRDASLSKEALEENARLLEGVLEDFGVKGEIIHVKPGPVVTLYELEPAPGIKSSRVIGLAEDIARSMSAIAARVAVVPGRNAIGIELPNQTRETVYLRELLASQNYDKSKAKLALTLGKTINGEAVIADLAKMPHLLVAGTTGSGKSVAINTMILSLVYKMTPEQCRLIMIDPKMLELSVYDGIPHLLTPVVTDPKKAVVALKWTVREMEERYKNMAKLGVRNIDGFNTRVREAQARGEELTRTVQTGFDRETGEAVYETEALNLEPMPFIVVIIDEMADLMMVAGKDIEGAVQRLAQMARAAGIHVIMATQRPSVDVITGTIKANFPTRISFQVTSKIDSRTILGEQGAEQLLGMGDMLYMAGGGRIQRVHGPFVADEEVEEVVKYLKTQGVPQYLEAVLEDDEEDEGGAAAGGSAGNMADSDDPYDQAVAVVLRDRKASTSYIQRRLGIGYNRAASLIERMEDEGLIGPANHAGKREILVPSEEEQMSGMQ
ncbi:MAG: DNA translocase FtsK [Pseudomonadota bacterium]